jgi:BMFP domain-containing protein YqiC
MIERQKSEFVMRSARDNLKFMDDLAKIAGGAAQSFGSVRTHVKSLVNAFLSEMDLVTREEFERVEALAQKARERQVELEKRLAALEKKVAAGGKAAKSTVGKAAKGTKKK